MATEWSWKPARIRRERSVSRKSGTETEALVWQPFKWRRETTRGTRKAGSDGAGTHEILKDRSYPCGFCKGQGERPIGSKCAVCRGTTRVSVLSPPAVRCAFCRGSGEDKPRSQVTCLACKGKGIIPVVEPVEGCGNCHGSGRDSNASLPCNRCRGRGVVTVHPRHEGAGEGLPGRKQPSGSEREVARVIYDLGEASKRDIGNRLRVSPAYADSLCASMKKRGYIEQVSRDIYVLSPDCAQAMQEEEHKEIAKLTPEEKAILRVIEGKRDECTVSSVRDKMGLDIVRVRKTVNSLGQRDFLDVLRSGTVVLQPKGQKALEAAQRTDTVYQFRAAR